MEVRSGVLAAGSAEEAGEVEDGGSDAAGRGGGFNGLDGPEGLDGLDGSELTGGSLRRTLRTASVETRGVGPAAGAPWVGSGDGDGNGDGGSC